MGVDAPSVAAGIVPALVHVDPAVGAVEALVALAPEAVGRGHACAVVTGVARAVVALRAVLACERKGIEIGHGFGFTVCWTKF